MLINRTKRAKEHLEVLPCLPLKQTDVAFLSSASEFRETIIALIRQAKSRIYITALYWQNDEAGQAILAEIYQAKANNPALDVKILVDWHRAQRNLLGAEKSATNADWYCEQRQAHGGENLFFGVPINTKEVFGVLHIKGFIFDDTIVYSGASINNVYLHYQDRYRYDRYQVITQPALADSMVQFIQTHLLDEQTVHALDESERPKTKSLRNAIKAFRKQLATTGQYGLESAVNIHDDLSITPLFGLGAHQNQLNSTIEDLFLVTQEKLVICTPYFNFPYALQRKLRRILSQGKKVEIIVGDKTANDFYIPPDKPFKMAGALPYLYEKNLRAFSKKFEAEINQGQLVIRLWKDGDNSYHLKGIWVDSQYILLTGNNLNPRAWRLDAENGLLIHDPNAQLQNQALRELEHIRKHTKILKHYSELEEMTNYPAPVQKLLKRFARVKADHIVKMIL